MLSSVKIVYQHLLIELPFLMVRKAYRPWRHVLIIIKTVESLYKEALRWSVPLPLSMLNGNQCTTCTEILVHFRPPTSVDGGWCLHGYAYSQGIFGFRKYLVCDVANVLLWCPLACRPFFRFIQSPVMPISCSMLTGRWCAMKPYFRTLTLSVLNGSWYQLHLRWNARWIQRILYLDLAEGEFLGFDLAWLVFAHIYVHRSCLQMRMFMSRRLRDLIFNLICSLLIFWFHLFITFLTRQCPGNHLVDSSIWLLVVSMLATLDISKAVDDLGNTFEPTVNYNNSVFRYVISWCKYFYRLNGPCF